MISTGSQFNFDLRISARRPLVPIEAVMVLADQDEDDVLNLVERGLIRYAWNIATPGAERREIRVWRDSLIEYLRNGEDANSAIGDRRSAISGKEKPLRTIIESFLPKPSLINNCKTIRGVEVARRLSCGPSHITNLLDAGQLRIAFPAAIKVSPYIDHESLVEFLLARELPVGRASSKSPISKS